MRIKVGAVYATDMGLMAGHVALYGTKRKIANICKAPESLNRLKELPPL
jgi:hypothetical protein